MESYSRGTLNTQNLKTETEIAPPVQKGIIVGTPYTEKGSKFFGFFAQAESVADFQTFMKTVQTQYKKASHYCFAYIINEKTAGDQISLFNDTVRKEKYSNAGEPSGCGNALLNILKQNKLENCALIVVRYFGGVLLGAGNLIRAYASAAKNALPNKN